MTYHRQHPHDSDYVLFSHLQLFPCNVWQNADQCNARWTGVMTMTHLNEGSWNRKQFAVVKFYARYRTWIWALLAMIGLSLVLCFLWWVRKLRNGCTHTRQRTQTSPHSDGSERHLRWPNSFNNERPPD